MCSLALRNKTLNPHANLQAFYFNLFGCFDNLAGVWVHERGVLSKSGQPLRRTMIGLGDKCVEVRASLSPSFQRNLASKQMAAWFNYLEDFRHALAHRIPLYIPPFNVPKAKIEEYARLERASYQALVQNNGDEYDRLQAEQRALGFFQPIITHSFEEKPGAIYFHVQLLADFKTVEAVAKRMLRELQKALSTS